MWFVVHVKPGSEAQAVKLLSETAKHSGMEEVFCPVSESVIGRGDDLAETTRPLIEGCVFALAPSKWELRACMRRADGMESLYDGDLSFEALEDGEEAFIDVLTKAPGKRIVPMSEGVVDRGRVVVRSGPLVGREGEIRRFSGRRRWAHLDARVAGAPVSAQVGLHVTRMEVANGEG